MKGFVINDLLVLKKQGKAYLVVFAVLLASSFFLSNTFITLNVFLMMMNIAVVLSSCSIDVTSGWIFYCDASPASRKDYVNAKYYVSVLVLLSLLAIFLFIGLLNPNAKEMGLLRYVFLNVLFICGGFIAIAVTMPLLFKLKQTTGKYLVAFTCGILASLGTLWSLSLQFAEPSLIVAILVIAITAAVLLASLKLSQNIYRKKKIWLS